MVELVRNRQICIYNLEEKFLGVLSEAQFSWDPTGFLCESPGSYSQHWADLGSLGIAHLKASTGPEDGHSDGMLWATETFHLGQYAGVPLPVMKDYTQEWIPC